MTTRGRGSVRIGPISLFALVIILCLAVMAVLSVTTAQATYAAAERQASFTADTYANERAAQEFTANVDAVLSTARSSGAGTAAALAEVKRVLPEASIEGSTIRAEFSTDSGRSLAIELEINADTTYTITSWKATTLWTENGVGETLWSGAAQTR